MHYECIAGNTVNPGHFITRLVRESAAPPRPGPALHSLYDAGRS